MRVDCPRCGQPVAGGDIELASKVALCRPCSELFSIEFGERGLALRAQAPLGPAYRPDDLRWVEGLGADGTWSAAASPPRAHALPLLILAVFWDLFVAVWAFAIFVLGVVGPMATVIFLAHGALGAWMTYRAVTMLVNRVVLTLDRETFGYGQGPLPLGRAVREPTANVEGFQVATVEAVSARAPLRYAVHLLTRDRRLLALRFGFVERAHAEFVAARLSEVLASVRAASVGPYRE